MSPAEPKTLLCFQTARISIPEEIEKKIGDMSAYVAEVGVFMKDNTLQAAIFPDFFHLNQEGILNIKEMFQDEVIAPYNRNAAAYKKINRFVLLKDELPKTRLGKIQRF